MIRRPFRAASRVCVCIRARKHSEHGILSAVAGPPCGYTRRMSHVTHLQRLVQIRGERNVFICFCTHSHSHIHTLRCVAVVNHPNRKGREISSTRQSLYRPYRVTLSVTLLLSSLAYVSAAIRLDRISRHRNCSEIYIMHDGVRGTVEE